MRAPSLRRRAGLLWLVMGAGLAVACLGGDDSYEGWIGRGGEGCHEWQAAMCDMHERCGSLERSVCDANYRAIPCASDETARECVESAQGTTCGVPAPCGQLEIADREEAGAACGAVMEALCAMGDRCGMVSLEQCLFEIEVSGMCSQALGYREEYEACLEALADESSCEFPPPVCKDVVIAIE